MPYKSGEYHAPLNWNDMQFHPWRGNMADMMEATRSAVLERMAVAYGVYTAEQHPRHLGDMVAKMRLLKNFMICGSTLFDFAVVVDMCMDAMMTIYNECYTAPVNIGKPYYHGSNIDGIKASEDGFFLKPSEPVVSFLVGEEVGEYRLAYNFITPSWLLGDNDRNWKRPLAECTRGSIPSKFIPVFEKVRNALDVMYKVPCDLWGYIVGVGRSGYMDYDYYEGVSYMKDLYDDAVAVKPDKPTKLHIGRSGATYMPRYTTIWTGGTESRKNYTFGMSIRDLKLYAVANKFPDCKMSLKFGTVYMNPYLYDYDIEYTGPMTQGVIGDYYVGQVDGPKHIIEDADSEVWSSMVEFPSDFGFVDFPSAPALYNETVRGYIYSIAPYVDFTGCFKFTTSNGSN